MAILGIRTAWGPQATKDRREHELEVLRQKEALALEKEKTKQLTKGDADVAAAIMGITPPAEPTFMESLGIDTSDPTTQVVGGLAIVGGALLAKRAGWF